MLRKFNFDYDSENDDLFLYDPKTKSKASIEIDDFIIDFNSKKELCAIELLHATEFFKNMDVESVKIDKKMLEDIKGCKVNIVPKNNFLFIQLMLTFKSKKQLITPVFVPMIREQSPALAY